MDCDEEEDNNISEQYEYFYQDEESMRDYITMNSVEYVNIIIICNYFASFLFVWLFIIESFD